MKVPALLDGPALKGWVFSPSLKPERKAHIKVKQNLLRVVLSHQAESRPSLDLMEPLILGSQAIGRASLKSQGTALPIVLSSSPASLRNPILTHLLIGT